MDYQTFIKQTVNAINALPGGGEVLEQVFKSPHLQRHGTWVEFGVWVGSTLQRITAERGNAKVYGFDSFQGLPEAWENRQNKGAFALQQSEIPVIPDAKLIVGWFQDTLPNWKPAEPITFAHIDCDIYSAASCALTHILPMLADGAIIVFDELFNYPGFEEHEMKALYEAYQKGLRYEWIINYGRDLAEPDAHPNDRGVLLVKNTIGQDA